MGRIRPIFSPKTAEKPAIYLRQCLCDQKWTLQQFVQRLKVYFYEKAQRLLVFLQIREVNEMAAISSGEAFFTGYSFNKKGHKFVHSANARFNIFNIVKS
jgi:hypothetical protein